MGRKISRESYEVVVIGAGPGGLVASLYLRRFLRQTCLVSMGAPRASWIPRTHNLLGYRGGISGNELLRRIANQIEECGGIDRVYGEARVERSGDEFNVFIDDRIIHAKKVILATGMIDTQPNIENLPTLRRKGLLRYCPVCDAFEYRDKKLLVLAQDSHGVKAARFLSRFSDDIEVLWPSGQKLPAHAERKKSIAGVAFNSGCLSSIEERKNGVHVRWRDRKGSEIGKDFDAVYVALGVAIQDSAFRHLKKIERNEEGFVLVNSHQETAIPGLFAIGDCVEGLAQIAVAAGQAAIAATTAHNQLKQREALKKLTVREAEST
jgi:thioredoxin reductase (NADPH)